MFRRSPRRTIEALPTQGIALIVALGRSDLRVTKQAQSKSIELSGSHDVARGEDLISRAR
jgi:hypothetical protein